MDPNATLRRWRQALKDRDFDDASEAKKDLQEWIRRGGFAPTIPMSAHERAALGIRGNPRTSERRKRPHVWRGNPKGAKLTAERVRINRQGYDSRGTYWGVGAPLYRVYDDVEGKYEHIRATTAKEAKEKARAIFKRERPWENPCVQNPNFHYPRTDRGRPKKAVSWNLGYYDRDNRFLGKTSFQANRADAHGKAKSSIGSKIGRSIVHRAVLTGPK
jgi:hypothetical protein